MKNKVSFSFVLFCMATLLSASSIIGIIPGFINQFRSFHILSFAKKFNCLLLLCVQKALKKVAELQLKQMI